MTGEAILETRWLLRKRPALAGVRASADRGRQRIDGRRLGDLSIRFEPGDAARLVHALLKKGFVFLLELANGPTAFTQGAFELRHPPLPCFGLPHHSLCEIPERADLIPQAISFLNQISEGLHLTGECVTSAGEAPQKLLLFGQGARRRHRVSRS